MYLLSKDVISFLFFPIYITMDTSILIAWKKKRESVMTRLKNYIVNIHNSKKHKTVCSILLILPTSVYILSWSWISPIQSVYKTQMCDKAVL